MAIYGRMGDEITLVREATVEDVLKEWGVKPTDKRVQAKKDRALATERVGYGMMWWCRSVDDDDESLYELAYCRADGGWKELDDTRETLMGEPRYSEAVRRPIPVS